MKSAESPNQSALHRSVFWLLFALLIIALALQASSLYVFPIPNALRWFGDETWLMVEAKMQFLTGVVQYPYALGSTVEHSKGLLLGMTWLLALLYGAPLALIHGDVVEIGRTVTFVTSLIVLIVLYRALVSITKDKWIAIGSLLLLVATRAFFYASHSTRSDMLAGGILLFIIFFFYQIEARGKTITKPSHFFLFGLAMAFIGVTSSVHLLILLFPLSIFYLLHYEAFKDWRKLLAALAGAFSILFILICIYYFTTGAITVVGASSGSTQFFDVIHETPILRPFSRSVQVANLSIRAHQFLSEAPIFLFIILGLGAVFIHRLFVRHRIGDELLPSLILYPVVILLASWLFLQGAQVTYLIHIMPALALAFGILLASVPRKEWLIFAFLVLCVAVFYFNFRDALLAREKGSAVVRSQREAIQSIAATIQQSSVGTQAVLTEPPSLEELTHYPWIKPVTDHFISFPSDTESTENFLRKNGITYAILFNSPAYPKKRYTHDPFFMKMLASSQVVSREIGMFGDMGRSYFGPDAVDRDTMILLRIR